MELAKAAKNVVGRIGWLFPKRKMQHVGKLFNFLDEKNFHNEYDGAYGELGLNQKDLFKSKSKLPRINSIFLLIGTKALKEPETIKRYFIVQFISKPKEGRPDYYSSSQANEKETEKKLAGQGHHHNQGLNKLNSQ